MTMEAEEKRKVEENAKEDKKPQKKVRRFNTMENPSFPIWEIPRIHFYQTPCYSVDLSIFLFLLSFNL